MIIVILKYSENTPQQTTHHLAIQNHKIAAIKQPYSFINIHPNVL